MKNTSLIVFDGQTELRLTTLSNKSNGQCPFFDDNIEEQLNKDFTLEFSVPCDHEDSFHLVEGNRVVFKDMDGNFQEFQIYKVEDRKDGSSFIKQVFCEHAVYEIVDDIVEDQRVIDGDVTVAMEKALSSSRWEVGQVDSLGIGTVNFYYENGMENLTKIIEVYGGELRYRVTLSADGKKIENRFVDLLVRRGADTGRRFEYKKDLTSIKRTIDMNGLKTALYVRGKGEQIEETGGYTRKVTIADEVWRVIDGDPVDKPSGQEWIGSPDALANFGRNNGTRHRFGILEVDSTDTAYMIQRGWEELQQVSTPRGIYEVGAQDLEVVGLSHEKVRLGDTVFIIDRDFKPELRLEARVIQIKRSLSDPYEVEIVLGNFRPFVTDPQSKLEKIVGDLDGRKGVWDKVENIDVEIGDGSFPNTPPPTPTNVVATGLFKNIVLEWDFNPSSYIATYEVYGSQVNNFTVDSTNLLFKGKVGGYVHPSDTNQTWYFRVRSVNYHGVTSSLSAQVSGNTARITTPDFEDLSVTNAKIGALAVDEGKIANLAVTNGKIKDLSADKINAGLLKAQFVQIGATTTYANGYDPSTKATPQDIKDYTKPIMKEVYDGNFINGKEFWTEDVYTGDVLDPATIGTIVDSTEAEIGKLWQIQGQQNLYSRNAIPINVNRVYRVTFKVRQTVDPSVVGNSKVYAGVVTLDGNFQNITGGAGTHRYCSANGVTITQADGWQIFQGTISGVGDNYENFRAGTKFVRPLFLVNYEGGTGTVEVDYVQFEDITEIQALVDVVDEVSLRTTEDAIIGTVRSSQSYLNDLESKANTTTLEDYATSDDLDQAKTDVKDYTDGQVDGVKNILGTNPNGTTVFEQLTEVNQKADAIDFKVESSGGVNLLKNSTGYAGTDFWTVAIDVDGNQVPIGSIDTTQDLSSKGVGSGFVFKGAKLTQTISNAPQFHTISFLVKKESAGSGYVKVKYTGATGLITETINFVNGTAYDYEKFDLIFETQGSEITVELYGDVASSLILTGIMLNIGNVALQWQHSAGEIYNTNVLMDLNGIRVLSTAYDGYTAITPEEFSGYARVDGEMERVFTLNKDVTEVSKLKADKEISLTPVKIVPVSGTYNGIAFISEE